MIPPDAIPSPLLAELLALPAEARGRCVAAAGAPDDVFPDLIQAATQIAQSSTGPALDATEIVQTLADRFASAAHRVQARRARARALAYAGQFDASLAVCREGVEIARDADLLIEQGRAHLASMHALGELGRLDEAARVGHEAHALFMRAEAPAMAARADINLGIIHQRHEAPARSLEHYDRARPQLAHEPLMLAHLDNSTGEACVALNDFDRAERAFERALDTFVAHETWITASITESNLADLAARQGRLDRALTWFERARRHLEHDDSPAVLARLLAEQADAKFVLGLPDDALREYQTAIRDLDRYGLAIEAARARTGLGLALLRTGHVSDAATALAAARTSFEELGIPVAAARVDVVRARIAAQGERIADARRLVTSALAELHDRPADCAAARLLLAELARRDGDPDTANAELAAALAAARRLDLAPLLADILAERGRLHRAQGHPADAARDLTDAVHHVERMRGALQADRFRAALHGSRERIYADLVDAELARDGASSIANAFAAAEHARARGLLDQVLRTRSERPDASLDASEQPADVALRAQQDRLRSVLNALYSRLADDRSPTSATSFETWRALVDEHERELGAIESRLAALDRGGWLYAQPAALAEVESSIARDEAVIAYFTIGHEIAAFLITPDGTSVHRALATVSEVETSAARLQFQIARAVRSASNPRRAERRRAETTRELQRLHRLLLAPLESSFAGIRHLTIAPHGAMHMLPFHALHDGTNWLIDRVSTSVIPSASLLMQVRAKPPSAHAGRTVVVGVADDIAPEIEREAEQIAAVLDCPPSACLLGADATVDRVRTHMEQASVVHLACHGRFIASAPRASGVRLADRWLTLGDLQDLRLDADLVTISGCETGLSDVQSGDEILGLQRSVFAAGARSIVVSLWSVDDKSTRETMASFHHSRHSGLGTLAALRAAQLQLRETNPHPAFWAPFLCAGLP